MQRPWGRSMLVCLLGSKVAVWLQQSGGGVGPDDAGLVICCEDLDFDFE